MAARILRQSGDRATSAKAHRWGRSAVANYRERTGGRHRRHHHGRGYSHGQSGRDSVFIPTCGLTVFGGIQPDRLEEFKGLEKDGLLQRFAINRSTSAGIERPDVRVPNLDQLNLAIDRIATIGTEGNTYHSRERRADPADAERRQRVCHDHRLRNRLSGLLQQASRELMRGWP